MFAHCHAATCCDLRRQHPRPGTGGARRPSVAAQSPLARLLNDAPLADGARVGPKLLESPLRQFLERFHHRGRHLRILETFVQVGEETWLPPARHRHHMRVPDQDDGLEGRTDDLVGLIGVELVDEGVAEFDDRLGYLAHSGHCHADRIPKAMGANTMRCDPLSGGQRTRERSGHGRKRAVPQAHAGACQRSAGGEEHLRFGRVDTDRNAQKLGNGPDEAPGTV